MKSLHTVSIFEVSREYVRNHYMGLLFAIGTAAANAAGDDDAALVDYVTYHTSVRIDALSAAFILSASEHANAFLKQPPLKEETWQDYFMAIAQYALEADVHAWLKVRCQEDKSPIQRVG